MKLKIILVMAFLCLFSACSLRDSVEELNNSSASTLDLDGNGDNDGDGIQNGIEISRGSNPLIADLPELKVNFLQNYKIEVFYHGQNEDAVKDQKSFVINTDIKDTNPDFLYRVGSLLARESSLKKAASFARFPNHAKGIIEEKDFSWVKYPDVDPKFFHENSLKYREIFNESNIIDNIKVTLTNQVKLNSSPFFKEVKDLKLNFYFYNHESENYELLKSIVIDRHFQAGIFESFETVIENVPVNLIKDSFFKRGEFIISEIEDYTIPSLETNYTTLLRSIKAKTVPVLLETPLEERLFYVATREKGVRLQEILKTIFERNFEVKEDSLIKIKEFQNNLPEFNYLSDVSDKDKLGRWFVITNEFKDHYLDRLYLPSDRIILAYTVGKDLAVQKNSEHFSFSPSFTSNQSEILVALGKATLNSGLNFQLNPINKYGTQIENEKISWETPRKCGQNCVPKHMVCLWDINKFTHYDGPFTLTTKLTDEAEKLYLVIEGEEFKLTDLLKEKKIQTFQIGNNVHFEIKNLSQIREIKLFEEVSISLKLKSFIGNTFFGVKLIAVEGDWQGVGGCPFNTPQVAEKKNTQISKDSIGLDEIIWLINDLQGRNYPYRFETVESGDYFQEVTLGVSSSIKNYYN